ncbi:hypothetical protein SAMN05880501_107164 [Ureibacillus xyleni]|uniref:Uncharacterized protein n=1 Tax=Ureibacillus xyleni TaxID=614648 RepID=A0A285SY84_9BACL|nr:hypothetical protein [Ureibacillus xyleni]SOC13354.1 hypothetical protein SAMN05880501_107164 [Ureibacillus xyleni]
MGIFFWPFMIASIVLSVMAIASKKASLLVITFILFIPISLYLAATPRFEWWGMVFPLFYLGAAYFLRKNIRWLSAMLISPNILLIGWIGFTVMFQ